MRRVNTTYKISAEEWDKGHGKILIADNCIDGDRLHAICTEVRWDLNRFAEIQANLGCRKYDVDELVRLFVGDTADGKGLFGFAVKQIWRLKSLNRVRCSETLSYTLRSFMKFRGGIDIDIQRLNKEVVEHYEAFLKAKGLKRNSTSFYMRNLRSVYRYAVDQGLSSDNQPFRTVYTGIDKTIKRAIAIDEVRRIRKLDLSDAPSLDFARDILLFSFYMRGMSFVDIAYLRKKDIHGDHILYCRRKTGRQLSIELSNEALSIINKYPSTTQYLLPIITAEDGRERQQYKNKLTIINRSLKKVGEKAQISIPLSTYVIRHAWATIARDKGIELSVISRALGHENESTTQIYLDSISTLKVDMANRAIIDELNV